MDTLPRSPLIDLPNELWISVFYWATFNYTRNISFLINYQPFQNLKLWFDLCRSDDALLTKRHISLVCKKWNSLSEPYLYEEFRFHRETKATRSQALVELFERKPWVRHYVKMIVLPEECKAVLQDNIRKILALCPNVQAVVDRNIGHSKKSCTFDGIDCPNLQYLECRNAPIAFSPQFFRHSRSSRVLCLHNLRDYFSGRTPEAEVRLYDVETLRIRGHVMDSRVPGLDFPGLVNLVLENASPYNDSTVLRNLPRVRTLEIGNHHTHLHLPIHHALKKAEKLEQHFFHVFSLKVEGLDELNPTTDIAGYNESLKHLGLCAFQAFHTASGSENANRIWHFVLGHFKWFLGERRRFPSLQTVMLYGREWGPLMSDSRFDLVRRLIDRRGVTVDVHPTWSSGIFYEQDQPFGLGSPFVGIHPFL